MRTRILGGCAVIVTAGLGVFAASGFGERSDGEPSVTAVTATTHEVRSPPPGVAASAARASLFKVIYKSTNPTPLAAGYNSVKVRSCPRGAAVLSAWFVRAGDDKTGMIASGSTPEGTRRWSLIVNNTAGANKRARFGIICLEG